MQYKFTQLADHVMSGAREAAREFNHQFIGTEHILIGLLREHNSMAYQILKKYQVTEEKVVELMNDLMYSQEQTEQIADAYTPRCQRVIELSYREALRYHCEQIGSEHILMALIKNNNCIGARLLSVLNLPLDEIQRELSDCMKDIGQYQTQLSKEEKEAKTAKKAVSVLEQYSRNLTELAKEGKIDPVIGRSEEIERIIQILSRRTKNNPCLIGEPGVGKTSVVEGLAEKIYAGDVPETIKDKKVIMLDLSGIVAGSKYRGEFEERMKQIIQEVSEQGDILLFIDEIHSLIGAGGAEGAIDAANILKPALARGELQVVGATTTNEYRKHIEKDAALERRFQPVMINEPTEDAAIEILTGLKPAYEAHHHVQITEQAVRAAVNLSARYITDRFLPDKAIDLIDEAASKARIKHSAFHLKKENKDEDITFDQLEEEKIAAIISGDIELARTIARQQEALNVVTSDESSASMVKREIIVDEESVAKVVSEWTKIPVTKLEEGETEKLVQLESVLHERVIGQNQAVNAVARAIRRGRIGFKATNRPTGSFLFLGPTGVGKTELSKALTEAVFGREEAMIRVDMSEYMEKHSVSKLIGSPPGYVGYDEGGQFSEKIRRNPYSLILFDEIEKAHPDVFNILLQILDDGHMTDAHGRKIDFKNTIIIMTSNVGASVIMKPKKLGFTVADDADADYKKMENQVMEEVKHLFRPELLNRIDEKIVFHSLSKEDVKSIVRIMVKGIQKTASHQLQIQLDFSDQALDYLAEKGYDPEYGARPLRRTLQREIEDRMAEAYLMGKVKPFDHINTVLTDNEINFIVVE